MFEDLADADELAGSGFYYLKLVTVRAPVIANGSDRRAGAGGAAGFVLV
jgi:hypothetical protein